MSSTSQVGERSTSSPSTPPVRVRTTLHVALLAGLSLTLSAVFVAVSLAYNQGHLIAPLDDVYIHLRYAAQIGNGDFLRYHPGDPISTGASSFLYVLVLGAVHAIGIQGTLLLAFAVGVGIACFVATTVCAYFLGRELVDTRAGLWAGTLVAVNGSLVWGSTSGMEVGMVALLVTASVLAFAREAPTTRFVATPVLAALAALARPEALVLAAALCAAMAWSLLSDARVGLVGRGGAAWRLTLVALPLATGLAQSAFHYLVTGRAAANGALAKSLLYASEFSLTEFAHATARNFQGFVEILTGLSTQEYVFPGASLLFVLGVVHLVVRRPEWRVLAIAVGVGLVAVLLAVSTLVVAPWHNLRYIQPFLPLFLVLVVVGIVAVSQVASTGRSRSPLGHALLVVALLFGVGMLPTWAVRLGEEAGTIREAPVSIAHWLGANLPEGATIAVNDAGAAAYFSGHRTVDLIGLTTNGLALPAQHGIGSLYEALREMPEEDRPDYFSIYDEWPGSPVIDLRDASLFPGAPLVTFDLKSPAHASGFPPPPCQSERTCTLVSVHEADWSLAGSGDAPPAAVPGRMRDHVNVGSLRAEDEHAYEVEPAVVGLKPVTSVRTVGRVVDSGRRIVGAEAFTVGGLEPGRAMTITARVDATGQVPDRDTKSRAVRVSVDGIDVGVWDLRPDASGWTETTFAVPARAVGARSVRIELRPLQDFLSPYPDYLSFGYWVSQ